jgi:hypothetical protein
MELLYNELAAEITLPNVSVIWYGCARVVTFRADDCALALAAEDESYASTV